MHHKNCLNDVQPDSKQVEVELVWRNISAKIRVYTVFVSIGVLFLSTGIENIYPGVHFTLLLTENIYSGVHFTLLL